MEYSLKGYADDVTLISSDINAHKYVLQTIDMRAADLDLSFKPSKCVSFLFDGTKVMQNGLTLVSQHTPRVWVHNQLVVHPL